MISAALVQHAEASKIPEMNEAATELERQGISVMRFHAKHLLRHRVPLAPHTLVVGEIPVVESALKQLGVEPPLENCYPEVLRSFLHRRVWPSTLREVTSALITGSLGEVFVKPRGRIKTFTGRMLDAADVGSIMHHAATTAVWCSEVVSFASEHRAFVVRGEVKSVRRYRGDAQTPDVAVIQQCVDALTKAGHAAAYAIDFGVLRDGRTVLLEVNDGYSLGTYGCPPEISVEVLTIRWAELVSQA